MTLEEARFRSLGHLARLEPSFQARARRWYDLMTGTPLLIYCSLRTPEEQDALYAQGRVAGHSGAKVTNAKGTPVMQSLHGYGKAYDWCPLKEEKGGWATAWENVSAYKKGQKIALELSIRHLTWELPHLEDGLVSGWRECVMGGATDGDLMHRDNRPEKIHRKKKFFVEKSK